MTFLRRFVYMLASAAILWFYSEFFFWSMPRPVDNLRENLSIFTAYFAATYLTFCIVSIFRVRSLAALFLAGAIYGWLIEAVIVNTTYNDFPYNIVWTGVSWHGMISVVVAWYFIRRQLVKNSAGATIAVALMVAAFWIAWSSWWWMNEEDHQVWTPNDRFAFGAFVYTIFPALGYWILGKIPARVTKTTVWELVLLLALAGYWYSVVTIHSIDPPWKIAIAPVVFGVTLLLLWKNRRDESGPTVVHVTEGKVSLAHAALFYIITATVATGGYMICHWLNTSAPVNLYVYWTTIPLSALLYVVSAIVILKRQRELPQPASPEPTAIKEAT